MKLIRITIVVTVLIVVAAVITVAVGHDRTSVALPAPKKADVTLRTAPQSWLGLYSPQSPQSYAGVGSFTSQTGVRPNLDMYYSGWGESFQASFASTVSRHGGVPLIQMDPTSVSLAAIASGRYDGYLGKFATAVRSYANPVVIGFGHEMNGNWYTWASGHASPTAFVAAWRHIVTLFRTLGADNVTWLWTINVVQNAQGISPPGPWWPGASYVTWVGIDGYYAQPSMTFASLFGPTIAAVKELTSDPILVSETAAGAAAGQPTKITDLYAGIKSFGLLGFTWFDSVGRQDWRLSGPASLTAFQQGAQSYPGLAR
jgi:mannan endo-1,4-beta-mannosidase